MKTHQHSTIFSQVCVLLVKECWLHDILISELNLNYSHIQCAEVTAVAQWLRCCATNRKVAGSIPEGVIGIFH